MVIKAGIMGGAGYTGGELLRLLLNHPTVKICSVHSRSNAGNPLWHVHKDLIGETDLLFSAELDLDIDVLFLCLGHGAAKPLLEEMQLPTHIKIIDLSNDMRLLKDRDVAGRAFKYGLPELNFEAIKTADAIANPGCFATAIQLGLLPLANAGLLNMVFTTGITGSTGAGQGLSETSHFSWRSNNIGAYKTLTHQHLQEITQSLQQLQQTNVQLQFVPWRGDFARGIFASSTIATTKSLEEIEKLYIDFYADARFVSVSKTPIFLKQVVNTNKAILQLEMQDGFLVVHSAIDNLLKGASGQAVQNMNIMFALPQDEGLKLKANYF